ncbi:MAG: HEAT repeat domain-containing protein [Thermoguttaceae bacterium]|jgi:HEAT repeat protein
MNGKLFFSVTLCLVVGMSSVRPVLGETAEEVRAKALTVLKSDAPLDQKSAACRDLARVGNKDCVPVLAGMLGDEKLSHIGRYALEPIPDRSVDEALRAALGTLSGRLLCGVISSVGTRRDSAAVGLLAKHLADRDGDVVRATAIALGRIGTVAAGKPLLDALSAAKGENPGRICDGLLTCGANLAAQGQHRDAQAIYDAMLAQNPPARFRAAALRGAVLCDPSSGMKRLGGMIRDRDFCVFAMALRIAVEMKDRQVADVLTSEIGNLPADRVVPVVRILGQRGDKAALPLLLEMAKKGNKPVCLEAIQSLAEIADVSAVPVLVGLMKDKDEATARAATATLTTLPGAQVDSAIVAILESPDRTLRRQMLEIAGQRRIASATPPLLKAMSDADISMRTAAAKSYGELAGAGGIPALIDMLLKAPDGGEIDLCERILGAACPAASDKAACARRLVDALSRAGLAAKPALLRTLRATGGPDALKAVHGAVADANTDIHATALRVLSEWPSPDAAPVLLELATNAATPVDKLVALRGYLGIALQKDVAAQDRLAICRRAASLIRRDEEKRMLLGVLSRAAAAESLDLVVSYLDDPSVKHEAVATVMAIVEKRKKSEYAAVARSALAKVVKIAADDPAVTRRAEELLKQMAIEK